MAVMQHLLKLFSVALLSLFRRLPHLLVWLTSVLCALWATGCASAVPVSRSIPPERVFNVCWKPPELGPGVYFDFRTEDGVAASTSGEEDPRHIKYVYKYDADAPASHLRLLPLSRVDAWCPHIPQPSILEVPAFEPEPEPCIVPRSDAQHLLGQTSEVPIRSPFLCDKQPRMAFTPQELMLMRARNLAYQSAYDLANKNGKAYAYAAAEMEELLNKDASWLKRAFTSDPGKLEEIQKRITDALNSIEELPEYSDPGLDSLAMAGYQLGFENGKFEVEAKLFAIDAGILILEVVALEIALGPLGGAKLLASAATKGTKAMKAAFTRVGNIPIFIPGATNGLGGLVRAPRAEGFEQVSRAEVRTGHVRGGQIDGKTAREIGDRRDASHRGDGERQGQESAQVAGRIWH
ncbi:MAG: hypothetical protein IPM54_20390 [Polyangiaceae bacterium]|nr:hypothetical protein [Polyangiaceae bacterium]